MGNLQVRFLEGWAPAMAPGYSTIWFLANSCPIAPYQAVGPLVVDLKDMVIPDLGVCARGQIATLTRAACARHATKHDKS